MKGHGWYCEIWKNLLPPHSRRCGHSLIQHDRYLVLSFDIDRALLEAIPADATLLSVGIY